MTIDNDKITEIFCIADDFFRLYDRFIKINGLAQRGQCSMGWFYGFKLHLICNEKGDLFSKLFVDGIQLVTKLKSNMKKPMIGIERVSPCENGLIQLSLF